MFNKFEHLSNGLTLILCDNTKEKTLEEVYIDTELFNYIFSFKVEWKVWSSNSKKKNEKFIGGTNIETKKVITLKKIIGEYLFGTGYNFTLINNHYFDLRKCNILNFKPGTGHSFTTRVNIEDKLKVQPQLCKKEDIATTANSNNVQIIEYDGKVLFLEGEQVVNELTEPHLKALLNKYLSQSIR